MIPCPETGCTTTAELVGQMTAHLVEAHLVGAFVALDRARGAAATADPYGLDRNGIKKHVVAAPAPIPPSPKETPVAKVCKLCERFAPEKCKRHGGAAAPKTKVTKTRPARRSPAPVVASPNGHANGAKTLLLEKLDEQIADTKAELRALERLRVSVA
jgi:hypothetical protein